MDPLDTVGIMYLVVIWAVASLSEVRAMSETNITKSGIIQRVVFVLIPWTMVASVIIYNAVDNQITIHDTKEQAESIVENLNLLTARIDSMENRYRDGDHEHGEVGSDDTETTPGTTRRLSGRQ